MTATFEYALKYAARGWPVFPTEGKRPLTAHGFLDGTTDFELLTYWWDKWPDANVALAIPLGLLVVDVDPRNGGVEADLGLPATQRATTPSGGVHLYFEAPPETEFVGRWPDQPGVDVKAGGKGYVLLPPSPGYRWTSSGIAVLPRWALDTLRKEYVEFDSLEAGKPRFFPWEQGTAYGMGVLRKGLRELREAEEGTRNNTLFRVTCNVSKFVAGGELSEAVLDDVLDAARVAGLDDEEVLPTMRSAYEAGMKQPRRRP